MNQSPWRDRNIVIRLGRQQGAGSNYRGEGQRSTCCQKRRGRVLNRALLFFRGELMTNDTAVQALLDYLRESDEPEIFWPRHHFEESCFSRWAAWEMIEAILDHPFDDPEDVIEEFAIKMVLFSSIADGTDEGLIFSIAADFADECLTLFREENSNDKTNHYRGIEKRPEVNEKAQP